MDYKILAVDLIRFRAIENAGNPFEQIDAQSELRDLITLQPPELGEQTTDNVSVETTQNE